MSHTITPTAWDESICGDCGFPVAQHETLYGPAGVEAGTRNV